MPIQKEKDMTEEQLELVGATVGLGATIAAAMDAAPGFVPCGTPAQVVTDALRKAGAEAPAGLEQDIADVSGFVGHVSEHRGVPAHGTTDVSGLSDAGRDLLDALLAFAASDAGALAPEDAEWLYRSLAALEGDDEAKEAKQLSAKPRA
jgi:hypothetical protein